MEERSNSSGNKVNISTQKMTGGIGLILMVLGAVPKVGILLSIVSGVLLIVSIYQISNMLKKPAIFNRFIIGFVLGLIGRIIALFFGLSNFVRIFVGIGMFSGMSIGIFFAIILFYIAIVAANYFYKQAYSMLANALNHKLFSTGALLMFIGAITIILFGLGLILTLIGWIILVVAFFTAPEEVEVVG
ncbi:MAG: DUF996 domain-containing protein [Hydrogenobaculum sp.]